MASMTMHAVRPTALIPSPVDSETKGPDTFLSGLATSVDASQFDSETEDYDALPSGPATAAALLLAGFFTLPVMAASLVIIPVTWAARSVADLFGSGKSSK